MVQLQYKHDNNIIMEIKVYTDPSATTNWYSNLLDIRLDPFSFNSDIFDDLPGNLG